MRTNDIENVGQRRPTRDVLRDARQLLVRRLLQGRGDPVGARARDRGLRDRPRPPLGHRVRDGRGGGRGWVDGVGLAPERIVRRGMLDANGELANYWHTHTAGPGGPCSEIFVDRGPKYGPEGGPDVDEERFMEIWNLVFIQDQVDARAAGHRPAPREERRHRLVARARRDAPPGCRERLRDGPAPPHPRGRRVDVGEDPRWRSRPTTSR